MPDNQTTAQEASQRLLDSMFDAARAARFLEHHDAAQCTINDLHYALWIALKARGGEIVVTEQDLIDWGEPMGRIEWLTDPRGNKIIRIMSP